MIKTQSIPNQTIGYLKFIFYGKSKSGKTEVWLVKHKDNDEGLGIIDWRNTWRQYWLYISSEAGFTRGCLRDAANFLDLLMGAHKQK